MSSVVPNRTDAMPMPLKDPNPGQTGNRVSGETSARTGQEADSQRGASDSTGLGLRGADNRLAGRGEARENGTSQRQGPDADEVQAVAEDLKQRLNTQLEFEIDDELDRPIVRVTNPETDEVIRQIPPEAMLALSRQLQEAGDQDVGGMLLDELR